MKQNKILKDFKRLYRLYDAGKVFVAFDTETTTLTPSTGRILEIGSIKFSKNGIIGTWNCLFNPQQQISPLVTDITGIKQEDIINQPVISEKLHEFTDFINEAILIGHNVQFDLNFLNFECENSMLPKTRNKVIDTLQYSIWAYPDIQKHKLSYLNEVLNLNAKKIHRAQDDAETCMNLFLRILSDTKTN